MIFSNKCFFCKGKSSYVKHGRFRSFYVCENDKDTYYKMIEKINKQLSEDLIRL